MIIIEYYFISLSPIFKDIILFKISFEDVLNVFFPKNTKKLIVDKLGKPIRSICIKR
jgi:hypothetical protein